MDIAEAIKKRRSVRSYKNQPLEPEKLALVLEAARLAPSAYNNQDWRFVVVQNKETLAELSHVCDDQAYIAEAGAAIVCCSTNPEHTLSSEERAYPMDLSIAASFMMLQAVELELATCWVGAYNPNRLKRLLRIPEEARVACILVVGYPHYIPVETTRKPLEEIAAAEHFDQPFTGR